MVDYTMCRGNGCDKRNTCYRFTATPSQQWQSWGLFEIDCITNDYHYYIDNQ